MSYTYLQDAGEESSAASFSDITLFAPLKSNPTAAACSCNGSGMACCHDSQSGMTCEPSTGSRGEGELMSSAGDSHARTYPARPKAATDSMEKEADYGQRCAGSLAKFDQNSCSWKTRQCSLWGGLTEYSDTWPRWGIMQHGELLERTAPEHVISGNVSGLLGTPLARMWKNRYWWKRKEPLGNLDELPAMQPEIYGHLAGKQMSLTWLEHHMIMPLGWSDLAPLETGKFQRWLQWHGAC